MVPVGQCFCPQFRNMPGTWWITEFIFKRRPSVTELILFRFPLLCWHFPPSYQKIRMIAAAKSLQLCLFATKVFLWEIRGENVRKWHFLMLDVNILHPGHVRAPSAHFCIKGLFLHLTMWQILSSSSVQILLLYCPLGPFWLPRRLGWGCDWAKPDINGNRDSKTKKKMI